ncbi:MAG: rod shape-determining protein MreC [Burkholderiaceae bacterium]
MPLGTLDRTPPPFFKQGPSALSKLVFFSALAVFLMVADARLKLVQPLRSSLAALLYPAQWLVLQPVRAMRQGAGYLSDLDQAQQAERAARAQLAAQSLKANQVDLLTLENARLRQLLLLHEKIATPSLAAEVLYDAADAYTRKVIIDKGAVQGIEAGSPVIDEGGVLGQVTRVHPLVSEVTLVIDRDQAIPVLNTRTGARSVAYGDPLTLGGSLELRFMGGNADVQAGDLLATSGVDGVYPPGLPVATVNRVERRADSAFARIHCEPKAQVGSARHLLVLKPVVTQIPAMPPADAEPAAAKKKR